MTYFGLGKKPGMFGAGPIGLADLLAYSANPKPTEKALPLCAQDFLRPRISSDPAAIRLHDGGSVWNRFDNSVTYGNDIYLAGNGFNRTDEKAMENKFHEIDHTSQNVRMNLTPLDHALAYIVFGGHDNSPLESNAIAFAKKTYGAYRAAGLDKTCPF